MVIEINKLTNVVFFIAMWLLRYSSGC